MEKEQSEFLKEFEPKQEDILNQPLNPVEQTEKVVEKTEEKEEVKPNRQVRRLTEKLQQERESGIALAARLEALSESQKFRNENDSGEYAKSIERIYGTNSPEAKEATDLLAQALKGVEDKATERALERFREEQKKERDEVALQEKTLDSMIEDIESDYNVTVDEPTQKAFFQLLQKLSPKDSDGKVKEFADPDAVWEELQSKRKTDNSRQKDLASRSMVKTGMTAKTTVEEDAELRFLKENGII